MNSILYQLIGKRIRILKISSGSPRRSLLAVDSLLLASLVGSFPVARDLDMFLKTFSARKGRILTIDRDSGRRRRVFSV